MSEYQYYEFRALDQPLSADEMASLRSLSSRAEISATRLAVTYNYGDFRGDPVKLMQQHFDLMVYVSNWGYYRCLIRLPEGTLSTAQIKPYLVEDTLSLHTKKGPMILEFVLNLDGGGGWVHEDEGPNTVEALLPLREMLLQGDLAPLYVGWLGGLAFSVRSSGGDGDGDGSGFPHDEDEDEYEEDEEVDADAHSGREPPVPAGLKSPAPALKALADFLGIPDSLLQAAAEVSPEKTHQAPSEKDFDRWLSGVSAKQQADWLTRFAFAQEPGVGAEVMRAFRTSLPQGISVVKGSRSGAQLIQKANAFEAAKRQKTEQAKARKKAALAREKEKRREAVAADPEKAWKQVDTLVETRQEASYDQAVEVLVMLRELAQQDGAMDDFKRRLKEVRQRHVARTKFHQKMAEQKLYAR
jgi:hypothetical protein